MKYRGRKDAPIRVGISTCLLGENVRFDSGHKRDRFVTDILGDYFHFIPVCPEMDVGMGVPREAVHLVDEPGGTRMVGVRSGKDWTTKMRRYSDRRVKRLAKDRLSGYILKSKSPSCGMERVKLFHPNGNPHSANGVGMYAEYLLKEYPLLPVEEEGRLHDIGLRENFIVRVFAYHRLQELFSGRFSRKEVVRFHTIHKYLLLAHSPKHYTQMGKLVAAIADYKPTEFQAEYSQLLMEGLKVKTTTKKNVNVLMHIVGFFKKHLPADDKKYLLQVIDDYHRRLVPLVVPLTLIKRYVDKYGVSYLADQIYLSPHPKELMLRNHV